jgi:hypothetical protein
MMASPILALTSWVAVVFALVMAAGFAFLAWFTSRFPNHRFRRREMSVAQQRRTIVVALAITAGWLLLALGAAVG